MFDDQITAFNESLSGFVELDFFQLGIRVLVAYFVLIWLASAFWAYRDMRLRSASAFTPYVAAAAIIVFTPIFFLFGLLLYRIVRPKETIAEVNERVARRGGDPRRDRLALALRQLRAARSTRTG